MSHFHRFARVVPHEGFWKTYKNGGVDFLHARAYIDFNVTTNGFKLQYQRLFLVSIGRDLKKL